MKSSNYFNKEIGIFSKYIFIFLQFTPIFIQFLVSKLSVLLQTQGYRIIIKLCNFFLITILLVIQSPLAHAAADLLFYSNFGAGISLGYPIIKENTAFQSINGRDQETGYNWPIKALGSTFSGVQMITINPTLNHSTLKDYAFNKIRTLPGPNESLVNALYMSVLSKGPAGTWDAQSPLMIQRPWTIGDLNFMYITYWYKLPSSSTKHLVPTLANDGGNRLLQFEFKTGGFEKTWTGDYRTSIGIEKAIDGKLYWSSHGDNQANSSLEKNLYWHQENHSVPVPTDTWYKVEFYVYRSKYSDGLTWAAINGETILNRKGSNMGINELPITRLMVNNLYTGGEVPVSGNLTGLEIWKGFPCGWKVSCYNFDHIAPYKPVLQPLLINQKSTSAKVTLTWSPTTDNVGTAGYYIYRNGVKIGVSTGINPGELKVVYVDTLFGAPSGSNYKYEIIAFDTAKNESPKSNFRTIIY